MKGIVKVFIVTAFLISIASCERKTCKDVICPYGKTCSGGACLCPNGLEGANCDVYSSDKYVGSYIVYESCPNSTTGSPFGTYNTYISSDPSYISRIYFTNLLNQGQAYADIYTDGGNNGNIIRVPTQNLGAITIYGEGVYDNYNHRINIDFSYTFNFNNYQCTHTFYKQ